MPSGKFRAATRRANHDSVREGRTRTGPGWRWIVTGGFVATGLLATSLWLPGADRPRLPAVARPPAQQPAAGLARDVHLDKTPPRQTVGLDLVRNGWTYNCMECHTLITARWRYDRPLNEHPDIKLEHGNNRFCLNCHHATNRNAFVDYDGTEIPQRDDVQLCAKCHGTIHRDWQAGVHGRENGYWRVAAGPRSRLTCIQCHDPHRPKFPALRPLAPLRYPARAPNPPKPGSPVSAATH